jgi:hypothetical protein
MDANWLHLSGWAMDPESERPAETVLVFVNGHYLGQGGCGWPLSGAAQPDDDAHRRYAGFGLLLRVPGAVRRSRMRVVQMYVLDRDRTSAWLLGEYQLQT